MQLLAQQRFRPWNGVFLSADYLSGPERAEAVTRDILAIYSRFHVSASVCERVRACAFVRDILAFVFVRACTRVCVRVCAFLRESARMCACRDVLAILIERLREVRETDRYTQRVSESVWCVCERERVCVCARERERALSEVLTVCLTCA